jgi:acetylornithine deacetylase/succinyl-diaminopimelate desuccinylase-like protein
MADVIHCIRDEILVDLKKLADPILGSPTISVGTISGGSKTNIVPDFCQAEVDIRTIPNQDTSPILEKLRAVCPGIEIETWESKPMFTDPNHPLVHALEKAGGNCVGAPWFCDAAIFSEAGIPAVACGPGSIAQAHTEDEFIRIADLENGVAFFRRFFATLQS